MTNKTLEANVHLQMLKVDVLTTAPFLVEAILMKSPKIIDLSFNNGSTPIGTKTLNNAKKKNSMAKFINLSITYLSRVRRN